jgi:hypothetical protein
MDILLAILLHLFAFSQQLNQSRANEEVNEEALKAQDEIASDILTYYPIGGVDDQTILNVLLYHMGGQRLPIYCEVAGQQRRFGGEDGGVRSVPDCRSPAPGVVEVPSPPLQGRDLQGDQTGDLASGMDTGNRELVGGPSNWGTPAAQHRDRDDTTASPTGPQEGQLGITSRDWTDLLTRLSRPKYRVTFLDVLVLMKRYLNTPMNALPYNDDWFVHPKFSEINHTGLIFDNAMRAFRSEINKLSLASIYEFQTNTGSSPVYSAGSSSLVDSCYWSLDQSLYMLLDLLHFQYDGNFSNVLRFLKLNYVVLEKESGKKNCLCIIGPASSGKNFWTDGVCDFTMNPGKMENPSRNNTFAFASCHNRRVIKWDECNYDRSFDNDVLNLLQGKTFLVNIKYRNMEPVNRTPVFVLANLYPFTNELRFQDRVYRENWQRCERLKRYARKQPLPLAHGLLILYSVNLIEDTTKKIQRMWNHICNVHN